MATSLVTDRRTCLNLMCVIWIIGIQTKERQIALSRPPAVHTRLGVALRDQVLAKPVAIVTRCLESFDVSIGLGGEAFASHRKLIRILTDRHYVRRHRNAAGYDY